MTGIAWIGTIAFSLCALPQAIRCYRRRSADDLSWWFLGLWGLGEACHFAYVWETSRSWPLLVNYGLNGLTLMYLLCAKLSFQQPLK